jgi:hypothetical protein
MRKTTGAYFSSLWKRFIVFYSDIILFCPADKKDIRRGKNHAALQPEQRRRCIMI